MSGKKIIIFPNTDKQYHQTKRILICGGNNSGKTQTVLNILMNEDYDNIYVLHNDINSDDYNLIDHHKLTDLPSMDLFNRVKNNCLLIEDFDIYKSKHIQNTILNIFRQSSHFSLSIITTSQNFYYIQPSIRRMISVVIICSVIKMNPKTLKMIFEYCDIDKNKQNIIKKECTNEYDSIMINIGHINKVYKNLFDLIEF